MQHLKLTTNITSSSKLQTVKRRMAEKKEVVQPPSFTSAVSLTEMGLLHVPKRFILPVYQRPNLYVQQNPNITLPLVDLALLHHNSLRPHVIHEIGRACKEFGFFQVINHGIPPPLTEGAIDAASEFFNLPEEEKMSPISDDVKKPVRYGTSLNHVKDNVHFWGDFLKHYSHPLSKWVNSWPSKPPQYREQMRNCAEAIHKLSIELMGTIFESLGLMPNYLKDEMEEGMQVMAVNCYPACPEPELALGMPPHSDYGCLTILSQNCQELEVMDKEGRWASVPAVEGVLLVLVGDHLEVMSNGRYKSVVHRATVNAEKRRISIASLHSLGIEKKVGPVPELVDDRHLKAYGEISFKDFLDFLYVHDITKERFIETEINVTAMRRERISGCVLFESCGVSMVFGVVYGFYGLGHVSVSVKS